jgi:hypothetical protein
MNAPHVHQWRKQWSDGITGKIQCDHCETGLLIPVGDLAWWSAKPKKESKQ